MTEKKKREGDYSGKRLAGVMGMATTVLVIALVSFMSVGMVGAAMGVGIGGFVANFDDVEYTEGDAAIYPVLGAQAACDEAPQLEASLDGTTTLDGDVEFYKDLPLPDSFGDNEIARIAIAAEAPEEGIDVEDLDLRLTALEAESLELGDADIQEFSPEEYDDDATDEVEDSYAPSGEGDVSGEGTVENTPEFGIDASSFEVTQGTAAAHQVSLGSIDLQNLDLFVAIDDRSAFDNPVDRAVEPTDRDCESLADESGVNSPDDDDLHLDG